MAIGLPSLTDDALAREFVARFTDRVALGLREKILERLQPDIDAAVQAGLASMRGEIEAYADHVRQRVVFKAIINNEPVEIPATSKANTDADRNR